MRLHCSELNTLWFLLCCGIMCSFVIHSLQNPNSHILHAAKLQWPSLPLFKSGRLGIPPWSHSVIREFTKLPGIINTLSYWRVVSTHAVSREGAQHNLCNVGFMPSEIRTRSNQLNDIDSFQRQLFQSWETPEQWFFLFSSYQSEQLISTFKNLTLICSCYQ